MSCEHDMANGTCSQCDPYVVQNLRAALQEAIAFAEEGWSYASDYFRDKWLYEERRCELRAIALAQDDGPLPEPWAEKVMAERRRAAANSGGDRG